LKGLNGDSLRLLQAAQMLTREIVTIILNEKLACVYQNGGAYVELLEANCGICHPLQECLLILNIKLHNRKCERQLVCHDAMTMASFALITPQIRRHFLNMLVLQIWENVISGVISLPIQANALDITWQDHKMDTRPSSSVFRSDVFCNPIINVQNVIP